MTFIDYVTEKKLYDIYNDKICYSDSRGIDKINNYEFQKKIDENIKKILQDLKQERYQFKPYKVILIPKKYDELPRKVCVPTIRDRIVIEALKEYLYLCYQGNCVNIGINHLLKEFIDLYTSNKYKMYYKIDLKTFFDTINHKLLIKKISKKVEDKYALELINKVVSNKQFHGKNMVSIKNGVPQGLSISMALANIFMLEFDNNFKNKYKYFRYVDDMIILYNKGKIVIKYKILNQIIRNKLIINRKKTKSSEISMPFIFLGYHLSEKSISVKEESILKIETSIENIFKNYKRNKNKKELIWRLNLRISGAVANNKKYGWLFYYNLIDNINLLYHLDWFVERMKKRYNLNDIKNHSFVKTYFEIKKGNITNNDYFLNIDHISNSAKKQTLIDMEIINSSMIDSILPYNVDQLYKKFIFRHLRSLEADLDSIS